MILTDGKCSFCHTVPKEKEHESVKTMVDYGGTIRVIEPVVKVKYTYYECSCGMRYSPEEVQGE